MNDPQTGSLEPGRRGWWPRERWCRLSRSPAAAGPTVTLLTGDTLTLGGVNVLAAGKLDPRLFDVTEVAREGYADRATLPLIVEVVIGPVCPIRDASALNGGFRSSLPAAQ